MTLLHDAWNNPDTNLIVIRGKGGEGKTALVAAWMAELAAKDWRGAERVLDWSFYSQGTRDQASATSEVFIHDALEHLGDPDPNRGGPEDRAGRLARLIGDQRCLLVLDGLEPLQYPPGPLRGALKDPGMAALLRGLAARNAGLCVVTTREKVDEIQQHYGKSAVDHELKFLSPLAGARLLHNSGARRAGARSIPADDRELQDASQRSPRPRPHPRPHGPIPAAHRRGRHPPARPHEAGRRRPGIQQRRHPPLRPRLQGHRSLRDVVRRRGRRGETATGPPAPARPLRPARSRRLPRRAARGRADPRPDGRLGRRLGQETGTSPWAASRKSPSSAWARTARWTATRCSANTSPCD